MAWRDLKLVIFNLYQDFCLYRCRSLVVKIYFRVKMFVSVTYEMI